MARECKIERSLNVDELQSFNELCMEQKDLTLGRVQELFKQVTGEYVSKEGARTYKRNVFDKQIAKLQTARDFAEQIGSIQDAGAGHTLADASRALLSQQVFELIADMDYDPENGLGMVEIARIVKSISDSNQKEQYLEAVLKEKELKIQKLSKENEALKDVVSDKKLSPEERENRMKEILGVPVV